jgi:hypothetical protein
MFGQPGGGRRRIQGIVAKFREKGATSPDKAMTAHELGLPPRFEESMKRRLGATGIFVEVSGKYYLDEARLRQIGEQRGTGIGGATGGQQASRRNMLTLRMLRMVVGISAILLAVSNIFIFGSLDIRLIVIVLVVLWIALTAFQLYYLARGRRGWGASGINDGVSAGVGAFAVS